MPDLTPLIGAPVPIDGEALDGPNAFSALMAVVEPHTVLWASSVADRDNLYGGTKAPLNAFVICRALRTAWIKRSQSGSNQFDAVVTDSGWVTDGFAYPTAGWDAGSYAKVRNVNGTVDCRMSAVYSGADITANPTNGNITDLTLLTIPSEYAGDTNTYPSGVVGGYPAAIYVTTGGTVRLRSIAPGQVITAGDVFEAQGTWLWKGL